MVKVGDIKYLNARSRLSLSKHKAVSSGSFTVLHIKSAMLRAALCLNSWSDSLHKYLNKKVGMGGNARKFKLVPANQFNFNIFLKAIRSSGSLQDCGQKGWPQNKVITA